MSFPSRRTLLALASLGVAMASGCCGDDFTKIEQATQGDAASKVVWSSRIGDAARAANVRLAAAGDGTVIVAASLQGDVKIAGAKLIATRPAGQDSGSAAPSDVVVWKLRANGKPSWARRFGDGRAQDVNAVALTGAGVSFVGGRFEGSLKWGKQDWNVADGSHGGFVAALDPSGVPGWGTYFDAVPVKREHGSGAPAFGADVCAVGTDDMGRLFVMGQYEGKFRIHGKEPIVDAPSRVGGVFFARFDLGGGLRWFRLASYTERPPKPEAGKPLPLRVDGQTMCTTQHGNVILVGTASGEGAFVGERMKTHEHGSLFVSAWSQTGDHLWDYLFPISGEVFNTRVAVSGKGDLYVAAISKGKISLGETEIDGTGAESEGTLFAARLEPSGKAVWLKKIARVRSDAPIGLSANDDGFLLSATTTMAASDFGGGTLFAKPPQGMEGVAVVGGFDPDGKHRWSRGLTSLEHNSGGDVALGQQGRAVFAGLFNAGACAQGCKQDQLGDVFVAALGK